MLHQGQQSLYTQIEFLHQPDHLVTTTDELAPGGLQFDERAINAALLYMERVSPDDWRLDGDDHRDRIFPLGTRVKARGQALEWRMPGPGGVESILQVAQVSLPFRASSQMFKR